MNRLLEAELIYGRLMAIAEPHLVERYNRALVGFGLKPTTLHEFEIDMTGFSPQVAEELGDPDYLDPKRVNRRFIVMTPDQENLPVVHTSFSNTAGLMHEFFTANARAIGAVTIRDALYGEIEDNVAEVASLEDLLAINEVHFRVLSAEDILGKATELRGLIDRLKVEENVWRNDALIERMVELARITGDIRQNVLVPDQLVFRHDAFWANHFGGVFVFVDGKQTTVICDPKAPGFRRSRPWQVAYLPDNDPAMVYDFLARTGRIELPRASWVEASGLLKHRAQMILEGFAARLEPEAAGRLSDPVFAQSFLLRHASAITEEGSYPFLQEAQRVIAQTGSYRMEQARPEWRFLLIRALPGHADQWLTSRLIARLTPDDYLSRFVFDKEGFYAAYEGYAENWREHVVRRLTDLYLSDKRNLRMRLYGIGE
ncbi:MAG: hypothetical protein LCH47_10670 [Proteobacteria bacterium]|nr:hypothetical protein [Pseudomonadota bacterium]